jgi:hypothetical protein
MALTACVVDHGIADCDDRGDWQAFTQNTMLIEMGVVQ